MRLVTFNTDNTPSRAGLLIGDEVVDIHETAPELPASVREILAAGDECLRAIGKLATAKRRTHRLEKVHLGPPVPDPQKIICIGQNYRDHCAEQNAPIPERPIIFAKFPTALTGPRDPVRLPKISQQVDYEVELAFVIGRGGKHILEARAFEHVAGYMVLNDVTARDIQFGDKQWVRGKTFDTFAPCGPALVMGDEVPDPHALALSLTLNGQTMQTSRTDQLIFRVPHLVAFLSQVVTLLPGDIVTTGTPPGVGAFRKPPVWLKPGDKMKATVEGLGSIENTCVAE